MSKRIKRGAGALLAAVGIAAGTMTAVAPQAEAATPGNLQMYGWVNCYFKGWGPTWDNAPGWRMHRVMGVRNTGDGTMTGVSITEIAGQSRMVQVDDDQPAGELRKGQSYRLVDTTWRGCWPSSVSGYTIGHQTENILDNAGFWANVNFQDGDQRMVPTPDGEGDGA